MFYLAYVHKDKKSAYGLTFPDFEGCFAAADTLEELPAAAQEAVQVHFEGESIAIPPPSEAARWAKDKRFTGGYWMLVDIDLSKLSTKAVRLNISLPERLVHEIDEFALSHNTHWTFELYVFVLCFAVVLYLICAVLVPSELGSYANYRAYFYSRRRWLFGLLLAFSFLDFIDSALKGTAHLLSLGWTYLVIFIVRSTLLLIAIKTRNERFHGFIVLLFIGQLVLLAFRSFHTMQ